MIASSSSSSRKIGWCKQQPKGIRTQKANRPLAESYLESAKETLALLAKKNVPRLWQATHKYYALYFCACALLMSVGIRSEIHECTIALITALEQHNLLDTALAEQLRQAKQQRIDNQYYLKNQPVAIHKEELNTAYLATKRHIATVTEQHIENIRAYINTL